MSALSGSSSPFARLRNRYGRRVWFGEGLLVGLFLSRVVAETSFGRWRLAALLAIVLGCVVAALALRQALRRFRLTTWPVLLLALYVFWPWAAPGLAGGLALAVVTPLLLCNVRRWPTELPLAAAVFLVFFGLYVSTLSPGLLPADSGEFQLVSSVLGIAHPPGYPLYTMLGKLVTLLPIRDMAYRVNLFSAFTSALTLAVLAWAVRRRSGSNAAALACAGMLGLSATFWAQSTTANIRSLTALLTALCVVLLVHWGNQPSQRLLAAFAACFGLAVGHHASLGLLAAPFGIYLLLRLPRLALQPRRWPLPLGALAVSLLPLAYLPLRSRMNPAFDPLPIRTWADLTNHLFATGFRGDFVYFRTWPELIARFGVWANIMRLEFGLLLPFGALLGLVAVGRRNGRLAALLGGVWLVNTLAAITYRAPQTVEYLMPSYVAMALGLGYGLGELARAPRRRPLAHALLALLLVLVVRLGWQNAPSFAALHGDDTTRTYAESILRDAPADAVILANWHHATPFWYLQTVEGLRADVDVRYVYPEGATPNEEVWLRRIGEDLATRPVIVTNRFYAFEDAPYRWTPFHGAWLVSEGSFTALPEQIESHTALFEEAAAGAGIELLGYHLAIDAVRPGDTLELRVYWRATRALAHDYTAFAQLLGPTGLAGQGDLFHRSSQYIAGEIRVDAYRIPLMLHATPGAYQLITGFYTTTAEGWQRLLAEGVDHVVLGGVTVQPASSPAATLHPLDWRMANGLRLAGVDYDRSVPGQTRVLLHWFRPAVSVLAVGPRPTSSGAAILRLSGANDYAWQGPLPNLLPGEAATVVVDVPEGLEALDLALLDESGRPVRRLGPWHGPNLLPQRLRVPAGDLRYVPLGGQMVYTGLGSGAPDSVAAGEALALRPRFLALRPLVKDYSVSMGLRGEAGWEVKSDGTPALGAIPTLKWIRGWQVADQHTLTVPEDVSARTATLTLEVYDAFTLESLQVLDERLAQQGQGVTLRLREVAVHGRE
ncbi:MAG: glycosyltransferase family 117 protein [Anaerolineae bacterium]